MRLIHHIAEIRQYATQGGHVAFVPTMGNLHQGHLDLIRRARTLAERVVTSVFVNRLQFTPYEDFDSYPRTLNDDVELLHGAGCDIVFAPAESALYPQPQTYVVQPPAVLADILEGEFRPGFFGGVCTVVTKLFNCVQPTIAVFGKKDYQQLLVIRQLVEQLALPIQIEAVDTARAPDGLALSSRNAYLGAAERVQAPALAQALRTLAQQAADSGNPLAVQTAAAQALQTLRHTGWQPDYLTLRRRSDLLPPQPGDGSVPGQWVVLGAARLGRTRLIDNIEC